MSEEIQLYIKDNLRISDEDLVLRTTDTENNFVERKTISDSDGWLKTAVAFANSCPIGFPGILYIGVADNGLIQHHSQPINFENLQKRISSAIEKAWPPIYFLSKTLRKNDAEFVAVIVPGSELRPHFSGPSFVRVGPESRKASAEQFEALITERSSKVRALRALIGKQVIWRVMTNSQQSSNQSGMVFDCNQFFLTLGHNQPNRCFPVHWITISYEPSENCYVLIIQS